jgi:hypothetical protein
MKIPAKISLRWIAPLAVTVGACWSLDYGVTLRPQRNTVLVVGDTVRLTAEYYADGPGFPLGPGHERVYTSRDRPARFQWSSSDSTVLRVDPEGLVAALAPGQAEVTARVGGISSPGVVLTVQ